jgi:hypothetical protein
MDLLSFLGGKDDEYIYQFTKGGQVTGKHKESHG